MNALSRIDATDGIQHREDGLDRWTVTIDGIDTRTITRADGEWFYAWIGHRELCRGFHKALHVCADHARYLRTICEEAAKSEAGRKALLAAMSPEQRASRIEDLEMERDDLDYADAHVNIGTRKAALERQIAALRAA